MGNVRSEMQVDFRAVLSYPGKFRPAPSANSPAPAALCPRAQMNLVEASPAPKKQGNPLFPCHQSFHL